MDICRERGVALRLGAQPRVRPACRVVLRKNAEYRKGCAAALFFLLRQRKRQSPRRGRQLPDRNTHEELLVAVVGGLDFLQRDLALEALLDLVAQ